MKRLSIIKIIKCPLFKYFVLFLIVLKFILLTHKYLQNSNTKNAQNSVAQIGANIQLLEIQV